MLKELKKEFSREISKEFGIDTKRVMQSFSVPKEEFGDIATNIAFAIAKEQKKNPVEIAEKLCEILKQNKFTQKISTAGPYVNVYLRSGFYHEALKKIQKEKGNFGRGGKTKETIMVEFFHANTHKGVHIGHIRNISLGEALSKILEFNGKKVIRVNYQGDIGPHVAKCLWGFINLYNQKAPKENRGIWLGKVYFEASKKIQGNIELEQEVQKINQKLYSNDLNLTKIWKETREWCLDDFEKFYLEFGVKFDELYFESQVEKLGKKISLELLKEGIAKKDQNAVIMDLRDDDLGVFVLITREGYPLYSAKDLGLAKIKFDKYKLDKSIHVVGKEQEFHFRQLFKTFEKMGFLEAWKKSYHLIYELVMLPEGKMSSRDGTMVLYEDLKNKLIERTKEEIKKRHLDWDEIEINNIAKKIALAAMKFAMIKIENNKTLVFDWENALNLEGETGPYIQYAYVRTKSILEKENRFDLKKCELDENEKRIIRKMCEFEEIVQKCSEDLSVYNLCEYLLDMANSFNKFYTTSPVLTAENEKKDLRLAIVSCSSQILKNGLELIGIECLDKM
ncbi:MAG: arginine--tRNA ligase [Candidatus Micrarchaeia archaeon]